MVSGGKPFAKSLFLALFTGEISIHDSARYSTNQYFKTTPAPKSPSVRLSQTMT
jgi:hypothetical protein